MRPAVLLAALLAPLPSVSGEDRPRAADPFRDTVLPFLNAYCVRCHDAKKKSGELDLARFKTSATLLDDFRQWEHVVTFLKKGEMPPASAKQPPAAARAEAIAALEGVLLAEARKLDGDPGAVPPRRLTNAEYDNTIHDLTGVDMRPAASFPIDPSSGEGFSNTGEALTMSPSLFKKYYAAAEHVANHALLTPDGLRFAPHPAVTFAGRQKYAESAILRFYEAHAVDPEKHLASLWQYRKRPVGTVEAGAKEAGLNARYARQLWDLLEGKSEDRFVLRWLRSRWAAAAAVGEARALAADVKRLSQRLCVPETPAIVADAGNGPVEHLARRRRTAEGRDQFDTAHLASQKSAVDYRNVMGLETIKVVVRAEDVWDIKASGRVVLKGEFTTNAPTTDGKKRWPLREVIARHAPALAAKLTFEGDAIVLKAPGTLEVELPAKAFPLKGKGDVRLTAECRLAGDGAVRVHVSADGMTPSGPAAPLASGAIAEEYAASAAAFCRVFPNRFYHVDGTRGLSAGFHLIEGFFRDDAPLCRTVLTEAENRELDRLWSELYFITGIWEKMLRGFVFFERSERNFLKHKDFDPFKEEDPELVRDTTLASFQEVYLRRAGVKLTGDALAKHPISVFFSDVRAGLKWQAKTLAKGEPAYLRDLLAFAERAYRRPLADDERARLEKFYAKVCRDEAHGVEAAVRASIIRVLVSPHFAMHFTPAPEGKAVAPLPDLALASRLSYFLWAGPPDAELLALAKAGKLRDDKALREQARRMMRDPKVARLAQEMFGQWLGYRDFVTRDSVSRAAFPAFDDALRQAMFEEPTRLITHLIQEGKPITALLDGDETFVNAKLARHYGLPAPPGAEWAKVSGLREKGRGGVMGMAVFLTRNSQPERTSPVKRGFWVVHKVLGEHIPPPPPDVAVLPAKETDTKGKTIRQLLKLHVEDAKCASCHQRFDPAGLAMEGFDPIGRARAKDLAGRPIDDVVSLPDGKESRGVPAFASHLARERKQDFLRTLTQKLVGYALGRSLQLSDRPLLERMRADLEKGGYHLGKALEMVASSRQFREQRQKDFTPAGFKADPPDGPP